MAQNAELITEDAGRRVAGRRVAGHVITDRRIADRRITDRRTQNAESNIQYTGVERRVAERRIADRRTQNAELSMEYSELSTQYLPKNVERNTQNAERSFNAEHSTHHAVRSKPSYMAWGILALMVVLAGVGASIVKSSLSDDSPHKKNSPVMVTLLKPPPPPQIKEKLPEPVKEIPKEEIYAPTQEDSNPGPDDDKAPAGDNLGVDAEGTAGGDAFGLVGKKGGRSILAGGGGSGGMGRLSLLVKFAGYAHITEAEIRKKVMKQLDESGGIPKGKLQAGVRVRVDSSGAIIDFKIIGSSGNHKMDDAVQQALADTKLSEPPPDGMPRTMIIKITSQG